MISRDTRDFALAACAHSLLRIVTGALFGSLARRAEALRI
jgi:hypothetical protein